MRKRGTNRSDNLSKDIQKTWQQKPDLLRLLRRLQCFACMPWVALLCVWGASKPAALFGCSVTINNPLKYPISCQICRSAGQDALRGGDFHSGDDICLLLLFLFFFFLTPQKAKGEVLLTFKME